MSRQERRKRELQERKAQKKGRMEAQRQLRCNARQSDPRLSGIKIPWILGQNNVEATM